MKEKADFGCVSQDSPSLPAPCSLLLPSSSVHKNFGLLILGLWAFVTAESSDFSGRISALGTDSALLYVEVLPSNNYVNNYVIRTIGTSHTYHWYVTYVLIVAYVSPVPNALPNTGF